MGNPENFASDEVSDSYLPGMASPDVEVRRNTTWALWKNATAVTRSLMEALSQRLLDEDAEVRLNAAYGFIKMGYIDEFEVDPYVARLAQRLVNEEVHVIEKVLIVEALGRMGTLARHYSRILGHKCLEHEDWRLRLVTCQNLPRLGQEKEGFRSIVVRLKRDENEEVRNCAELYLHKCFKMPSGWLRTQFPSWQKRKWAHRVKGKRGGRGNRNYLNNQKWFGQREIKTYR